MVSRLRYIARCARHASPALRALISTDQHWSQEIAAAVSRARCMLSSRLASLPDPAGHGADLSDVWPRWQRIWTQYPRQWSELCRRLLRIAGEAAELSLVPPPAAAEDDSDGEWLCQLCGAEFISRARLKQHMSGKHRRRQPGFLQIPTSVCPFCKCDFRTRYRCLVHLGPRGSQACAAQLPGLPPLSPEDLAAALRQDAADRRRLSQCGAWHSSGPPAVRPQ